MAQDIRTGTTLTDKLLLIPHVARVIVAVFYRLLAIPFGKSKPSTLFKDIVFTALRANLANINVAQEQLIIAGTTESAYLDLAGKEKFQPETTVLSSGLRLHWLGPKTSQKVMVYFHGGGFALPCSIGHVKWLLDLQKELSKKSSVSVILVSYSLTPKSQYPEQLQQAAETLYWLVEKQGKSPGDIIVGGDSAGGNMALSLLSHLLHPHPKAPKIDLKEPLATAILISPWVKFSTEDDSFKRNATSDMLPPAAAARWASMFLGSAPVDEYSEPVRGDIKWYSGLDRVVKDVLIWGGGGEVLIDSIEQLAKTLKAAHPKTELVVQPGAAHEDFLLDVLLEYKEKGEGTKLIESWLSERV